MMRYTTLFFLAMLINGMCSVDARAADSAFDTKIKPFLKNYCLDCHGAKEPKGAIRLDNLNATMSVNQDAELWMRVLDALTFGEMPSDKATRFPTKAETLFVESWISAQLQKQEVALEDKTRSQGYGNLVNHDLLFGIEARNNKVDVAARLWRISPNALIKQMVANLRLQDGLWTLDDFRFGRQMLSRFNFDVKTNPFNLDKPHGSFRDFKGKYLVNSMTAEQLTELALDAAEAELVTISEDLQKRQEQGESVETSYKHYITTYYQRVLRRTPSDEEVNSLLALAKNVNDELGDHQGLAAAMCAVVLQPESLFRVEHVVDDFDSSNSAASENGGQDTPTFPLSRRDLAHALAYSLTDLPPNEELLDRIENDDRSIAETLRAEAERLLLENKLSRKRIMQFFQEYFDYQKGADVFKDDKHRIHWAPTLIADLDLLIAKVLQKDQQVLRTLLTTTDFCLTDGNSFRRTSHLAYNLPADTKRNGALIPMPKGQRMGVLTHPAWLVAHSGNFDNDPIRRGLWIRKKLLAEWFLTCPSLSMPNFRMNRRGRCENGCTSPKPTSVTNVTAR